MTTTAHEEALGETLEVEVERIACGGFGLARTAAGAGLLVPFAAPGDRLRVEVTGRDGRGTLARIAAILRPSPHRRAPRCPHFGTCGGCQLQHVQYPAQVEAKAAFVRDALAAHGLRPPGPVVVHTAAEWGYRNRTQLKVHRGRMGFHCLSGREVVDVTACPVLAPELERGLPALRAALHGAAGRRVHQVEGAVGIDGAAWAPDLPGNRKDLVEHEVLGFRYFAEPESFFQGNRLLVGRLVADAVQDLGGALAFDLYAGVGLFTLPLARAFAHVVAVEDERRAATLGRVNVKRNGCDNVSYVRQTTERFLRENRQRPDAVLLDPPRLGARAALPWLRALEPAAIVYVSCDPGTLARDLRTLADGGYAIESLAAYDMFPQTWHVECAARLRRTAAAAPAEEGPRRPR